jgi:hypothetical protein
MKLILSYVIGYETRMELYMKLIIIVYSTELMYGFIYRPNATEYYVDVFRIRRTYMEINIHLLENEPQ